MTLGQLTDFLGWWTLINLVLYIITVLSIVCFKDKIAALQGKAFGIEPEALKARYFDYIARYKILILAFNLAPYLALRLFF